MPKMNRREVLQLAGTAAVAGVLGATVGAVAEKKQLPIFRERPVDAAAGEHDAPQFFTPHEYATVAALADWIIPRDERSGSATDAGVPAFIDFVMTDQPDRQTAMRGGLAWLDAESRRKSGKRFVEASAAEQAALLDRIAYPERAPKELSQGVSFFNSFRDLTAAGFFSSKMGVEDLQFMGNVPVGEWNGCPDEACSRLGVSYPEPDVA